MKELSVVIPAYNEERAIGSTLERVTGFLKANFERWEVIVVDDGSRDRTAEIVRSFAEVRFLQNERNIGKGATVRRGVLASTLDPVLFTDTDLSAPIEEALHLYRAIEAGADVAIGSRMKHLRTVRRTPARRFLAWGFRTAVRLLALRGIYDTQCGFKMFRRAAAEEIFALQRTKGWAFDVELLVIARENRFRIAEVPVEWHESEESSLRLLSPFVMLFDLCVIRWHRLLGRYRIPKVPARGSAD